MSCILIIDDEEDLVALLKEELEDRGHAVLTACDGEEGVRQAKQLPDLIILDIMMPSLNGFEVCRAIRDEVMCPILFLSAKQSEADRIKAFTLGGDDYILKPFGLRELLVRIEANLRREQRAQYLNVEQKRTRLFFGSLGLDLKERSLTIHGKSIPLTRREYDIIELLAVHSGVVFSREQIYEKVWGYDAEGDSSTVVEHVKKIRAKIAAVDPVTEYIATVWGIGYKWNKM
ncbi:response regulator transcription factor [Paenibacillus xylaniclasticus]|uniref:response regulator transcription factor n=1 Tax=Paenibacillus xylaniclasticus TaxID=588083 RepID=UPI000FD9E4F8|nr:MULTISPECIES: response regulator transcription factor [Paenibacillus]GFN31386.1 DNA-binding response regulator [Paenibacillus curdlanolyticus]